LIGFPPHIVTRVKKARRKTRMTIRERREKLQLSGRKTKMLGNLSNSIFPTNELSAIATHLSQ